MTRETSWTNADGLVVGNGGNYPERVVAGVAETDGGQKEARLQLDLAKYAVGAAATVAIPTGSIVKNVYMKVSETAASAGAATLAVGDGTLTWITAAQGAVASIVAGTPIQALGTAAYTATEGQLPPKVYAAGATLTVTVGTAVFTAGKATLVVEYV